MISKAMDILFGCWHSHLSFPHTTRPGVRRSEAAAITGTYVVCLDCGKEFAYDWHEMKILEKAPEHASAVGSFAPKEAA